MGFSVESTMEIVCEISECIILNHTQEVVTPTIKNRTKYPILII